jgi:hypothetical protein
LKRPVILLVLMKYIRNMNTPTLYVLKNMTKTVPPETIIHLVENHRDALPKALAFITL